LDGELDRDVAAQLGDVAGGLDVVLGVTLDSISRQLRANVVRGSQQSSNCQRPSMNVHVRGFIELAGALGVVAN
jgi:hypothetical protein